MSKKRVTDESTQAEPEQSWPIRHHAIQRAEDAWLVSTMCHREGWDASSQVTATEYAEARTRALSAPINQ